MDSNNTPTTSFLSDSERSMLAEICSKHGLEAADVEALLNLEREKQSMGRRRGIHLQIREHVEGIAQRSSAK
jgi:hypothetical protein